MTLSFTVRIISLRPQLSLNALDVDGVHLDMQNHKHEASVESECGSALYAHLEDSSILAD